MRQVMRSNRQVLLIHSLNTLSNLDWAGLDLSPELEGNPGTQPLKTPPAASQEGTMRIHCYASTGVHVTLKVCLGTWCCVRRGRQRWEKGLGFTLPSPGCWRHSRRRLQRPRTQSGRCTAASPQG